MARSPSSPSSFRAPRSGFPRFQWLTDLSTAPPRIKCAPSPDRGIDNSALSAQMALTLFVHTRQHRVRFFLVESKSYFHAGDFVARRGAIASICAGPCVRLRRATRFLSTPVDSRRLGTGAARRDEGVREGPRARGDESAGVDRNRQESSLPVRSEAHEGNGSGAGASRLWGGPA